MEIVKNKSTKRFIASEGHIITDIHKAVMYGKEVTFMESVNDELFIEITESEAEVIFNHTNNFIDEVEYEESEKDRKINEIN